MTQITVFSGTPPALNQSQPNFDTNTQNFLDYISTLAPELNAFASALNNIATTTSSTSSNAISVAQKTFIVESGKSFLVGMSLRAANSENNYMNGEVVSYSGTSLVLDVKSISGSGTFTSWAIFQSQDSVVSTEQIQNLAVTNAKLANGYINDLTEVPFDPALDYVAIADGSDSGNKKKVSLIPSDTNSGVVELLTTAEHTTGTDTTRALTSAVARAANLVLDTAKASTSGTAIDFAGIPSWVKRITVMFNGVSTNGSANLRIQLGDAGGFETTGYASYSCRLGASGVASGGVTTGGFQAILQDSGARLHGSVIISKLSGNVWVANGFLTDDDNEQGIPVSGSKTLSDVLTSIRITTSNGTDTFDAGSINIMYE